MASENLVNDLFEIVQSNTKEKLSYDDFEKDLVKSINLPNDEMDRALSIMLSQAEVNPNVIGESKGGSFVISPSFSASVVSTIKYENQFIEGKAEFENRKNQVAEIQDLTAGMIIMTDELINKMIDSYQSLSSSERDKLWCSYSQMSDEEKDALQDAHDNMLKDLYENPNVTPKQQEELGQSRKVNTQRKQRTRRIRKQMDPDDRESLKEDLQSFKEKNPQAYEEHFSVYGPIENLTDEQLIEIDEIFTIVLSLYQRKKTDQIREHLEGLHYDGVDKSVIQNNPITTWKTVKEETSSPNLDMTSKSGKIFMINPDEIIQMGSSIEDISANKTYITTPQKQVRLLAKLDVLFNNAKVDDIKKLELLEILKKAIENITPEMLDEALGNIEQILIKEIEKVATKDETIATLITIVKEHGNLVNAIGEDKKAVLSKIITPYIQAVKEKKDVKDIILQNYPSIGIDVIDKAIIEYNGFFRQKDLRFYESERTESAYEDNHRNINDNIDVLIQRATLSFVDRERMLIKEEEYKARKLAEEDMIVDEKGLKKRLADIRDTDDLLSVEDEDSMSWGVDFGEFGGLEDYFPTKRNSTGETLPSTESIQGEEKEDGEENYGKTSIDENGVAPEVKSDGNNSTIQQTMNTSNFFNPKANVRQILPIRKIRMAAVVAEVDLIREAMQIIEQRKAEDKETNYGEEYGE